MKSFIAAVLIACAFAGPVTAACENGVPFGFPPEAVPDPNISNPVMLSSTVAEYPRAVLPQKLRDEVYVAFVVTESGDVTQVRAFFSQHGVFEAAAVDCVSKWKFTPAKLKGHPVATRMVVAIRFAP